MVVSIGADIFIENPKPELEEWCRKNLCFENPEYAKKQRLGFWLGSTPKKICLYEKRGDSLVVPYGCSDDVLKFCDESEDEKVVEFSSSEKVDYEFREQLYGYQERAVQKTCKSLCGILQAPAGSGKTQMGLAIIARLGRRALWLTHTKDLLKQSKDRCVKLLGGDGVGEISEGKVAIGERVTFATVQTMCRLDLSRYSDCWDVVIVDECHRCSGTPTAVTQFSKVLNSLRARHKYGLSATVHRADGLIQCTYALLGKVIVDIDKSETQDRVMQVRIKRVNTGTPITDSCLNADGTLNHARLISSLCKDRKRNAMIAELIEKSKDPCLILSERVEHLEMLRNLLTDDVRKKSVLIHGKTDKLAREKALDEMRAGEKSVLFATYQLAKEGLDICRLRFLYMATPQTDYAIVTQAIGRIARVDDGKKNPVCFDFVDYSTYAVKCWKRRCSIYRKNNCEFI